MKKFKNIYLEITNRCNLACEFCPSRTLENRKSISLDEFIDRFDKLKDYTEGIYLHILGEPLLNYDIFDMIDYASKYVKVNLTTNGTMIKYHLNDILNSNIFILNISLEALYFSEEDELREYLDVIRTLIGLNDRIHIHLRLWNDKDKYKDFNNKVLDYIKEYHLLNDLTILSYGDEFSWPNGEGNDSIGICLGGKRQLAIHVDGSVSICCLDYTKQAVIGNILYETLEDILNKEEYKEVLKGWNNHHPYFEVCKKCSYKERFNKEVADE